MKKALSVFLAFVIAITASACSDTEPSSTDSSSDSVSSAIESTDGESTDNESSGSQDSENSGDVSDDIPDVEGGFSVSGTKLLDANCNEFVFRGINHAHTWFKDQLDVALPAIAATGANSVRIVLSDGGQWTKDGAASVKNIIQKCKENKMIAILEVHDATGMDDTASLNMAADYWIELADVLAGTEAYVIVNIANEWFGSWNNLEAWRDAYIDVLPKLRDAGIKNTILVDSAGWGQCADSVLKYAPDIFNADPDANTMFSVHMYGAAGKNEATISRIINGAIDLGICLIIGEFGYNHSDGDVDEASIMRICTETGTGYLGWSWKGNGGGVEYLDLAITWDGIILSSDWGAVLIKGENGIKETSKICSVFE
ncbi:MAG: cellulase family glycosylhydrolase [Eubacterium sp.]|nr:cellulase family glycosylhydrolase [Eubacterium sp.]